MRRVEIEVLAVKKLPTGSVFSSAPTNESLGFASCLKF
jgi:hypothetical protein